MKEGARRTGNAWQLDRCRAIVKKRTARAYILTDAAAAARSVIETADHGGGGKREGKSQRGLEMMIKTDDDLSIQNDEQASTSKSKLYGRMLKMLLRDDCIVSKKVVRR